MIAGRGPAVYLVVDMEISELGLRFGILIG